MNNIEKPKREIKIDLYVFDNKGNILACERDEKDPLYLFNVVTMIILSLPLGSHPVSYAKEYLSKKGLKVKNVKLLPAIYLNHFNSEPHIDYLVFSLQAGVENSLKVKGESENPILKWMTMEEFLNHSKLMPEFKNNGLIKIFEGGELFYKGMYKDSDGTSEVISWEEV